MRLISRNVDAILSDFYLPKSVRQWRKTAADGLQNTKKNFAKLPRQQREEKISQYSSKLLQRANVFFESKSTILDPQVRFLIKAVMNPSTFLAFKPRLFVPYIFNGRLRALI